MEPALQPVSLSFSPWDPGFASLVIFALIVVGLMAVIMILTAWIGEKRENPEKARAYESGIIPTGHARFSYPVPFYLVATFFLLFDVEAAFIFSWAVAYEPLGVKGWLQISFFIIVLMISLFYLWKKGGLEWGPTTGPNL